MSTGMTASNPKGFWMWTWTPPRLLELAGKSLLRDEDLAIAALENLPTELFPPLFMAAYASGCNETLKAMVQAWPFARLPLGGLVQMPDQRTLQAVLGGLDLLLARKVRPRRWKLRVLDLRNTSQNFWSVWSAATTHECLRVGPVAEDSLRMKEPLGPLVVFIDLCLRHKALDEVFAYLISWATKRRKSLQLCCKKVTIFRMPIQNIKKVLNKVQLDCILEVEVKFTWKLSTLGTFASYLGRMTNLQRLVLSHIHEPSKEERQQITKFTSQLLQLHHLRKLHMDSPTFLVGCLDQMLRCLKAPLETLSITHCQLTELDLACLSQCLSISQLKELALNGVKLTSFSLKHLQVLLDTVAATLQDLELEYCDLSDAHLEAILPAVSRCHQLRAFSIRGNPLSMAIVGRLLHQTARLRRLSLEVYPAPLESYDSRGTIHLGRLAQAQAELREILKDLGRSRTIWLSTGSCPRCGSNVVCVSVPLTHPINGGLTS